MAGEKTRFDPAECLLDGFDLANDVYAVAIVLDHPENTTHVTRYVAEPATRVLAPFFDHRAGFVARSGPPIIPSGGIGSRVGRFARASFLPMREKLAAGESSILGRVAAGVRS
jgi:hypothetical protein